MTTLQLESSHGTPRTHTVLYAHYISVTLGGDMLEVGVFHVGIQITGPLRELEEVATPGPGPPWPRPAQPSREEAAA